MKKILVTTDLSANAKAGLHFAIQLASQNKYQLTILHVTHILKPTTWSDAAYRSFEKSELEKKDTELHEFVTKITNDTEFSTQIPPCIVLKGGSVVKTIIQYAMENGFNYICTGRNGSGMTIKLFGSTVSALISESGLPIIAVPENYQKTPITSITYVSDLTNIEHELKEVVDFTDSLKIKVELLHFQVPMDYLQSPKELEDITEKLKNYNVVTKFDALDYRKSFIKNMDMIFKETKPSMVIMFTKPRKGLFEKIFFSSISADYAHLSKTPLLIFKKPIS
jgi:nucleotide-binding universal stress UspA family protein